MALVVQHNMSAMNANNKMNVNVTGYKKATEKLSSGYQINRAGDNAAGLAISEKMRSQIRGLAQATKNANDGISLIKTAEGGLNETHSILQRMRELATQSANGTYTQKDRDAIQLEVDALKSEVDRISTSTEFNTQQLLDGSLSGLSASKGEYGPRYGKQLTAAAGDLAPGTVVTSSILGVEVKTTIAASGKGGENAAWDADGKVLTINLAEGETYNQSQINELIKNAKVEKGSQAADIPDVTLKLGNGVITATQASTTGTTVAGERAVSADTALTDILVEGTETDGHADLIKLTANSYGTDARVITLKFDVAAGKENVQVTTADTDKNTRDGAYSLHLATGVEYTEKDIQAILAKEGLDYSVSLTDSTAPDGDVTLYATTAVDVGVTMTGGAGVFKSEVPNSGEGLTFQIGANGVEDQRVTLNIDDMGADALGIANIDVSTRDAANAAIDVVDAAIEKVSMQRAGLGALQNRLEYTVNNLTTTNENLTDAESTIRDTDMATEMINYTKYNILQQASQAMLAQANQQPQAVLQLLG